MTADPYDVIVIGTDAGEGTLAHRQASSGKRILLLERGDWLPRELDNWDSDTVEEATAHPEVFVYKAIGQVAGHFAAIIGGLDEKPVVIGDAFGGLLAQILAGPRLARCRWRSTRPSSVGSCRCRSRR